MPVLQPPKPLISGLYAIVDPDFCGERDCLSVTREILEAGVSLLQVRIKGRSSRDARVIAQAICDLKHTFSFTVWVVTVGNDAPWPVLNET